MIFNLLPIGRGGGLQNAMSLVEILGSLSERPDCKFYLRTGSPLESVCAERGLAFSSIATGGGRRLWSELRVGRSINEGDVCFTLFGPPLFGTSGRLVNVVGCAYSNLLYPELEFWSNLKRRARIRAEVVDVYRRWMLSKADFWVFETEALTRRAVELVGLPKERVATIKMAPSKLVAPSSIDSEVRERFLRVLPDGFRFLHLCGAQPNKRVGHMAEMIAAMRRRGTEDVHVVTTIPEDTSYYRDVKNAFLAGGVAGSWMNLGPVKPSEVVSLLSCVDALCTFSRLESFSNNFVEAWAMGLPLVVTDADWARSSCGDAAVYVSPEDPEAAADKLRRLVDQPRERELLVSKGVSQLRSYPTPEEKLTTQMAVIQKASELGSCPQKLRAQFRWPRYSNGG